MAEGVLGTIDSVLLQELLQEGFPLINTSNQCTNGPAVHDDRQAMPGNLNQADG